MLKRCVTWFDTPEAAEEADVAHYANMSPQERLDEMLKLLNEVGHWNERRLVRTAQLLEVPRG